jgi:hypothetical protein
MLFDTAIFVGVGTVLVYVAYASGFRWWVKTLGHHRWPVVEGVVHRAGAEYVPAAEGSGGFYRSLFAYNYFVKGRRFVGFFAIVTKNDGEMNRLQRGLDGRGVSVRYKPAEPGFSLMVEKELVGFGVVRAPRWTMPGAELQELRLSELPKTGHEDERVR